MIVVVEGPDGAGKTTLARSLMHDSDDTYHHEGAPPVGNLYQHYADPIYALEFSPGTHVFDRLMLGELVYGPLIRGVSRISTLEYARFKNNTRGFAVHVLCLPPYTTCLDNWSKPWRTEMIADVATFKRTYDAWAKMAPLVDLVFDYTKGAR